jgi:glucose-6-phosphate isomerase
VTRADVDPSSEDRPSAWVLDTSRIQPALQGCFDDFPRGRGGDLASAVDRLYGGAIVNPSEDQPALHMALRAADPDSWPAAGIDAGLTDQRRRFLSLAEELHSGSRGFSDLIHIGIGGSDLGPRLLLDALGDPDGGVRVHCLSTLDSRAFEVLRRTLDPARTGVIVASKSFSTEETLLQARAVADWFGDRFPAHAWAATARADRAIEFGFHPDSILAFPAWTGGRFSMWSSVGTAAAAGMGRRRFEALLSGAARADDDFLRASRLGRHDQLAHRLAELIHGLRRQMDLATLGIVAYDPRLALLGDYLQQLIMESLGKHVDLDDAAVEQPTAPLVFSGRGTDAQHAMFQAFHQGTDPHPLILVGVASDPSAIADWQRAQLSHLLGQAEAFARGVRAERACQELPGGRPVSVLMCEALTPHALGYLLASFEHAVFALSVLWGINPFDQWGVEEGKRLAGAFKERLRSDPFRPEDLPTAGRFLDDAS